MSATPTTTSPAASEARLSLLRRIARSFRTRRRLKSTTTGRVVIAMTLAVGFAAFNTGNNLLFFGWGLLLSSIVVSGILSESTLRSVRARVVRVSELRAGERGSIDADIQNTRSVPAFAIDLSAIVTDPKREPLATARAYELRLAPRAERALAIELTPRRRGLHRVHELVVRTAFPFGFFEKEKRVLIEPALEVIALPERVNVESHLPALVSRLGESPARMAGAGDEIFSLRPHRSGDDPRRIAWKRSARTGRVVVRETEAELHHDVILDLCVTGANEGDCEKAICFAGSLLEELIARGHSVGVRAPGVSLPCGRGARQRSAGLFALALLDVRDPLPAISGRSALVVAVVVRGASASSEARAVAEVPT